MSSPASEPDVGRAADARHLLSGKCAEFCGVQHAGMLLTVTVHSKDDFARWVAAEQSVAADVPEVRAGVTCSPRGVHQLPHGQGHTGQWRVRPDLST